jgi:hypothetical protein
MEFVLAVLQAVLVELIIVIVKVEFVKMEFALQVV